MSTLKVNEITDTSGVVRRGIQTYAIISDEKTSGTHGGTFTSGAWRTRDLNNPIADPDSIVSIGSNQFTLGAGTYLIEATAPAIEVSRHQCRLYNVTGSSVVEYGTSEFALSSNGYASTVSFVTGRITITGSTVFEIQHRCQTTRASDGFGVSNTFSSNAQVYTVVKIFKEA